MKTRAGIKIKIHVELKAKRVSDFYFCECTYS